MRVFAPKAQNFWGSLRLVAQFLEKFIKLSYFDLNIVAQILKIRYVRLSVLHEYDFIRLLRNLGCLKNQQA
jgi:hypothetical protein